ncbi:MAG: glycosyltransferase [Pyrinomonadaceae bacterium]
MLNDNTLSAAIVLYENLYDEVLTVVTSFFNSEKGSKLFLIDNSPTDKLRSVASRDPRIEYVHDPRNTGYIAHNQAIQKSIDQGFKYHVVLNPDLEFDPSIFSKIIGFMDDKPDVGLLIPKVFYPDGRLQYACKLLPTPADFFLRVILPRSWSGKIMTSFDLRFSGYDEVMDAPYMSGCFMFLRNSTLRETGLFDERFFMYAEDIDLSRRIYTHSRSVFYPEVSIVHRHTAASYRSFKLFRIHFKNVCLYFNKYGWFFDKQRRSVNRKVLAQFKS